MSARTVAWTTFSLSVVAMLAALAIWAGAANEPFTADIVLYPAAYLAFGIVGALIVSRQPGNRIGRLALLTGVLGALVAVADSVARAAEPGPVREWAAWLATWGFPATIGPPLFLILLFPTGRLASPRWAIVAGLLLVGAVVVTVGNALTPTMADFPGVRNPVGVAWFSGSILEGGGVGWFALLVGAAAAAIGLVPRLRRARGVEREQLKWIAFAGALHGLSWIVLAFDLPGLAGEIAQYAVFATLLLIPLAAGIAILRYRLYDIDVVVRRTLVYAAVVGVLAVVYVSLVLLLQAALSSLTGGDMLPVALSTLAIAALFGPVRSRVRALVDRRFYRSRYDAQRTLEAFAGRLRDEVELDAVGAALVGVAGQAVRPTAVVVWLRPARGGRSPHG